jgi:quercetin dioxygenase-like cupin family protein
MVVEEKRLRSGTLSFAPNELVPEHTHGDSDEIYYVISGSARILIEEEIFDAVHGDLFFIAAGERHAIRVSGSSDQSFVILAFVAPNHDHRDVVYADRPFPIPPG